MAVIPRYARYRGSVTTIVNSAHTTTHAHTTAPIWFTPAAFVVFAWRVFDVLFRHHLCDPASSVNPPINPPLCGCLQTMGTRTQGAPSPLLPAAPPCRRQGRASAAATGAAACRCRPASCAAAWRSPRPRCSGWTSWRLRWRSAPQGWTARRRWRPSDQTSAAAERCTRPARPPSRQLRLRPRRCCSAAAWSRTEAASTGWRRCCAGSRSPRCRGSTTAAR